MTPLAMTLDGWGNVAQIAIAIAAILAFLGAALQIHVTRVIARRSLSYSYANRFNDPGMATRIANYQRYWSTHTYAQWAADAAQHDVTAQALLNVANLIEELAAAYNRKLLDRNVAAMYLGTAADVLWQSSEALIAGARGASDNKWVYAEWEAMLTDSRERTRRARHGIERRRMWRTLAWGE